MSNKKAFELCSWHDGQWSSMVRCMHNDRLSHAFLLSGPAAVGKQAFAKYMANYMVCKKALEVPCGTCKDCLLFRAETHPDVLQVYPEDKHRQIRVQQVRDIIDFLGCHANQGGYRVVIVYPAEGMNVYAANALLKPLEEPGAKTLLILVSQRIEGLLATIRSRCQQLSFPVPDRKLALDWLNDQLDNSSAVEHALFVARGRPLLALKYVQENVFDQWRLLMQGMIDIVQNNHSLVAISNSWKNLDIVFIIEWVMLFVTAVRRFKATGKIKYLHQITSDDILLRLVNHYTYENLLHYYDWLVKAYNEVVCQVPINRQLLTEALLVRWHNLSLS